MTSMDLGGIVVLVNGYTINNGRPYFQKAVPHRLRQRLGKATIKVPLRERDGNLAVQCHRLNEQWGALFRAMRDDPTLTPTQTKEAAVAMLRNWGFEPGDGNIKLGRPHDGRTDLQDKRPLSEIFYKLVQDRFPEPTELSRAMAGLMHDEVPVLLSEALSVYLENHPRGSEEDFVRRQRGYWSKVIELFGDIGIETLTREHARRYRDERLRRGVRRASIKREVATISAIIQKAILEVPLKLKNPFERLSITDDTKPSERREPYTTKEVAKLLHEAKRVDDSRRRMLAVVACTGARLAEIVGLRVGDVDLKGHCIHIRPHASRRIKETVLERTVPLLRPALEALRRQLAQAKGGYVFPEYASTDGVRATAASAALNKWSRNYIPDKSMHSFRHTMRDLLRDVGCPEEVQNQIGGWTKSGSAGASYGRGHTLEIRRKWLERAYKPVISVKG